MKIKYLMSLFFIFVCAATLLVEGSTGHAAVPTPEESLLVISKQNHTLSIIDPISLKVLAHMPVGDDPHEAIASADGKTAYVSNYGSGTFHSLAVLDLVKQKAKPSVDLGALRGPHGLDFKGGKVWFTAEGSKAIGSYDPSTNKVDWILGTGQNRTHMIFVADDLNSIITTNVSSSTVSMIEKVETHPPSGPPPGMQGPLPGQNHFGPPPGVHPSKWDWDETVIPVGKGSEGFDVSPDGKEIWVANAHDGTVSIIDRKLKSVSQTLPAQIVGANRLKFTPDGKQVLISNLAGPEVVVFDSVTRKEIKRIKVGTGASGILMKPDGTRAYIACTPDGFVVVIDLKTLSVVGKIDAGGSPDGMAWARSR